MEFRRRDCQTSFDSIERRPRYCTTWNPPLIRETSPYSPILPRETLSVTPPISRKVELSSTSFPTRFAHREVDILNDFEKHPIKPSFGGWKCKPEEVLSIISTVEDFFPSKYKGVDKFKATVIFLQDKARIWFDTFNKDLENCGLGPISIWSAFKELFLHQFLPNNYGEDMRQGLYDLKHGSLLGIQFKSKFDAYIAYFSN